MVSQVADSQEEIQLQVMRRLQQSPELSQRALARELGISLGSINYCFQALMEKGWLKVHNFSQSKHKMGYAYLLTPSGITQKARLTAKFLQRKLQEYDALQLEIEALKKDLHGDAGDAP